MNVSVAADDNLRRYSQSQLDGPGVERLLTGGVLGNLIYLIKKL